MKPYLLIYDLITSGCKVYVYHQNGTLVKTAQTPLPMYFPKPSWAEQDANDWWDAAIKCTKAVLEEIPAQEIAGVSFSTQGLLCLCVDKEGNPLHRAITWSDTRASEVEDTILQAMDAQEYIAITGNRPREQFGVRKLMWLKQNQPQVYQNAYKMLQCKDFLALRLTGNFVTDYADACNTGCLDVNTRSWSATILQAAGIRADLMPTLHQSSDIVGYVTAWASAQTGLMQGTPVVMGCSDGPCAAVGAGCVREGDAYMYVGSTSWITLASRKPIIDGNMTYKNICHAVPGLFAPAALTQELGVTFKWLKNRIFRYDPAFEGDTEVYPFKNIYAYTYLEEQLARSKAGANGLLFLPYLLGKTAAIAEDFAKGAYLGLTIEHTREDMLRAALEGNLMNMEKMLAIARNHTPIAHMNVVGNASHESALLQTAASVFNATLRNTSINGTTDSIGAAIICGVGLGIYPDFAQNERFLRYEQTFSPIEEEVALYKRKKELFEMAYASLLKLYEQL